MKPTICRCCGGLIDRDIKGRWATNMHICHHCDNLPEAEEPTAVIPNTAQTTIARAGSHSDPHNNRPGLSHIVV